jgi:hypothetical protein
MAIKLPDFSAVRTRVKRTLRSSTKLGSTTLWLGGLCILFIVLHWVTGSAAGSKLSGWATLVIVVFAFCALWLTSRWVTRHLMWRLRHRLIVTYIFASSGESVGNLQAQR